MEQNKLRVIVDYYKISSDVKAQLKKEYPEGFSNFLIDYVSANGDTVYALKFETDDKIYMIKIPHYIAAKMKDDNILEDSFQIEEPNSKDKESKNLYEV